MELKIGELFILGFRGPVIPQWLRNFEQQFGLGGIILFDYDCQTKTYENNIQSPQQVKKLCTELSQFKAQPLIYIDQEGGKVRRLKEKLGFAPLPSQQVFNTLPHHEKIAVVTKSFSELKDLGIHYNLAPVIDLNYNPKNPDIGAVERSYSQNPLEVRDNFNILNAIATRLNLGLCLKHYPGLGGATTNSHFDLTDLSDSITTEQLELFLELGPQVSGEAILMSHGLVKQWDAKNPISMSPLALGELRKKLPQTLFISDDLHMQGLQKIYNSQEACVQGLRAGLDCLLFGNNLVDEQSHMIELATQLQKTVHESTELRTQAEDACHRVTQRKERFCSPWV